MKKLTIFLILLFFASALLLHPDRVSVGSGVAERFIHRLYVFQENGDTAIQHFDMLQEVKTQLEHLELSYQSIPDTFDNAGTIQGIFVVLETLALTIMDVLAIPLVVLGAVIVFIVDAIVFIFNLLSLLELFTITI